MEEVVFRFLNNRNRITVYYENDVEVTGRLCRRLLLAQFGQDPVIKVRLHSLMRPISGCLRPAQIRCLPVLANSSTPTIGNRQYVVAYIQLGLCNVYADVFDNRSMMSNMVRRNTC